MKIGPKYKIAKRLGAPIFEKTQTQKFALSAARVGRVRKGRPAQMSDFKRQLIEKQKMRFSYGITEKQLRKYVDEAVLKSAHPTVFLMGRLEARLDNVAYRLGFAKTRRMSRQMVSHGHFKVNGKKFTIPSHQVKVGDIISVRDGSRSSGLFTGGEEKTTTGVPNWLKFDPTKLEGSVLGAATYEPSETLFDPEQVLEFYSR